MTDSLRWFHYLDEADKRWAVQADESTAEGTFESGGTYIGRSLEELDGASFPIKPKAIQMRYARAYRYQDGKKITIQVPISTRPMCYYIARAADVAPVTFSRIENNTVQVYTVGFTALERRTYLVSPPP